MKIRRNVELALMCPGLHLGFRVARSLISHDPRYGHDSINRHPQRIATGYGVEVDGRMYWVERAHGRVQTLNEEGFPVDRGKITSSWPDPLRTLVVRCSADRSEDRYAGPKVLAILNHL